MNQPKNMYKLSDTFKTGLSDYHKLILTVTQSGTFQWKPRDEI